MARPAIHQRAEQGRGGTDGRRQMLDQMGGGGFAIGAGDTDQGQSRAGLLPERRCQFSQLTGHRLAHHHHRLMGRWRQHRRR